LPIRIEATEKSVIAKNTVTAADDAITLLLSYSISSPFFLFLSDNLCQKTVTLAQFYHIKIKKELNY
jgi:hypothetical protein